MSNLGITARAVLKSALRRAPFPPFLVLEKVYWGLRFNDWLGRTVSRDLPYFGERFELYAYLNESVVTGTSIDYLEFGVANGDSIREWMRLNTHPQSRFFGFDTFEGLPEVWEHVGGSTPKGTFGAKGQPPIINHDPRVTFVKGLFQDTIPGFAQSFHVRNQLILHLDADLYSSTLYTLASLNDWLVSGTIILFDEFDSFDNEFRALHDFVSAFRKSYRVLACGDCYSKVAIQIRG